MNTPKLGIAEITTAQSQKEVTANEAFRKLETGAAYFGSVKDKDLSAPPGGPVDGDLYIVGASPTGDWAGQAGKLALWLVDAWVFITPYEGMIAFMQDENAFYRYEPSVWIVHPVPLSLFCQTTSATVRSLSLIDDNTDPITLEDDSAIAFHILGIAREVGGGNDVKAWEISGVIERTGATTAILGTPPSPIVLGESAGSTTWDLQALADDGADALEIRATGEAAHTINWRATVTLTKVTTL